MISDKVSENVSLSYSLDTLRLDGDIAIEVSNWDTGYDIYDLDIFDGYFGLSFHENISLSDQSSINLEQDRQISNAVYDKMMKDNLIMKTPSFHLKWKYSDNSFKPEKLEFESDSLSYHKSFVR